MTKGRIYCNTCKVETWHESVVSHSHERYNYLWGSSQVFDSEIFKCCGCEDVSFRLIKHPFEFQDPKDDPEELIYPERGFKFRDKKYFWQLPKNISQLYKETVKAYDSELIVLSTVGVRALIEAIVAEKISSKNYTKTLDSKINSLRPHFSESVIDTLHEFRKMGNKAAHELEAPESLNIHHALYVIEGILEFFYGIEENAKTFNNNRKTS